MSEKWVGKLEAISLFKVTDRTLDNWVKSGRIRKEKHKGQIVYEISQILEESGVTMPSEQTTAQNSPPPAQPTTSAEPVSVDEGPDLSAEIQVLQARLDEKNIQIAQLNDSLEKRQKDLNTLVLERGMLSEKSNQLLLETEALRKEREKLQKENEIISEKSFRRSSVYSLNFSFFVAVIAIIVLLVMKYQSENKSLDSELKKAEKRAENEEKLALDEKSRALKLQNDKDELSNKLSESKQKENLAIQKASEASERVSEIKKEKESLQKEIENQQKIYNQQLLELQDLKLKIKINETIEQNNRLNEKGSKKERESERVVKEKLSEKPIENSGNQPIKQGE